MYRRDARQIGCVRGTSPKYVLNETTKNEKKKRNKKNYFIDFKSIGKKRAPTEYVYEIQSSVAPDQVFNTHLTINSKRCEGWGLTVKWSASVDASKSGHPQL